MTIGRLYEFVWNEAPTYPTLWQRIVAWVKSKRMKETAVCEDGINLRALTCNGKSSTIKVLELLTEWGLEPTIERTTNKQHGWYARVTETRSKIDPRGGVKWVGGNFLKVASCHTVRYYDLTWSENSLYDNPFYNVERIISTVGERDDIHKKAKRKTKTPSTKAA